MSDTQHDPREVEALAKELRRECGADVAWDVHGSPVQTQLDSDSVARFILDREVRLVAALEDADALLTKVFGVTRSADDRWTTVRTPAWDAFKDSLPFTRLTAIHEALAAHRAAKQPSEPTLEQAVEAMSDARKAGHLVDVDGTTCVLVPRDAYNGAMAALAREQAKP